MDRAVATTARPRSGGVVPPGRYRCAVLP